MTFAKFYHIISENGSSLINQLIFSKLNESSGLQGLASIAALRNMIDGGMNLYDESALDRVSMSLMNIRDSVGQSMQNIQDRNTIRDFNTKEVIEFPVQV